MRDNQLERLIIIFTKRPVTVIMIIAAICIAAVFAFTVIPLDRLPEISLPRVTVETVYPGMAAADIRSLVTIPMEDTFSSVKGLESIRSVSRDGSSLVTLDFRWGTDPMTASSLLREAVDAVYPSLPEGVRKPTIAICDPDPEPHSVIAVQSLSGDDSFARRLADYEIRSRLRRIDGAGSVLLTGGEVNEGHLQLDVPRLAALGLSPREFALLLARETVDIPAGSAREGDMELVVVSSGRPGGLEELSSLILPFSSSPLRVSDAGELFLEAGRKKSIFVFNGTEAAALEIYRRPGADPVRLSQDIRKVIKEANQQFSHNASITLVRDSTPSLIQSMISLGISAAFGAAAVIAILFFFIRNAKISLLAALAIPLSASAGICVLAVSGRSLNGMSLGGLALGIGLVSDTAVIMLDLLNRHFGRSREKPSIREVGFRAASIAGSSVSSTITTVVVFMPVIFLPGPLGSLYGDTAIALVTSVFSGWIYAQLFAPSLFRFTFQQVVNTEKVVGITKKKFPEEKYRRTLATVLRKPRKWFVIAGAASLAGALLLAIRPAVFVNPDEAEEILVSAEFPPGTMLENMGVYGAALSGFINELPCIKTAYGRAGAEEDDVNRRADMDYRREELVIRCIPEKNVKPDKALLMIRRAIDEDFVREKITDEDKYVNTISVYFPNDRLGNLLGFSQVLSYAVLGKDRDEWQERAGTIEKKLHDKKSDGSVRRRPRGVRPELRLYPNREMAAYFGISAADIAESLRVMNEGVIAASLEIEGKPLDVRVSGKQQPGTKGAGSAAEMLSGLNVFENSLIKTASGKTVFLGSLGRIERREADAVLARLDRSDVVYIDIPVDKVLAKTAQHLDASYSWFFRAGESVFGRYRNALLLTISLALILIYMTMGAQFESFFLPLALMLTIPLSLAGAGPALLLFKSSLDSGAVMGLCALFGLVVNNGLILFEISSERIHSGIPPALAVYGGASIRLRPVLITSITTVLALLPVALNPLGSAQKSIAASMLGGLAASTLLGLFILPPVFIRFFSWKEKR